MIEVIRIKFREDHPACNPEATTGHSKFRTFDLADLDDLDNLRDWLLTNCRSTGFARGMVSVALKERGNRDN
jgi:hypothetical protein